MLGLRPRYKLKLELKLILLDLVNKFEFKL